MKTNTRIIDDNFDYNSLQDDDVITILGYNIQWNIIKQVMDEKNMSYDKSLPIILYTIKNINKLP
jgi:hypothetical protein